MLLMIENVKTVGIAKNLLMDGFVKSILWEFARACTLVMIQEKERVLKAHNNHFAVKKNERHEVKHYAWILSSKI